MISTGSQAPLPPLRTAYDPQSLPNLCVVEKTTISVRGYGKDFEFGVAQIFSDAPLGFRPS
jgi:hypothetical protein